MTTYRVISALWEHIVLENDGYRLLGLDVDVRQLGMEVRRGCRTRALSLGLSSPGIVFQF